MASQKPRFVTFSGVHRFPSGVRLKWGGCGSPHGPMTPGRDRSPDPTRSRRGAGAASHPSVPLRGPTRPRRAPALRGPLRVRGGGCVVVPPRATRPLGSNPPSRPAPAGPDPGPPARPRRTRRRVPAGRRLRLRVAVRSGRPVALALHSALGSGLQFECMLYPGGVRRHLNASGDRGNWEDHRTLIFFRPGGP